MTEHSDQRIDAESVNLASDEIADSGLGDGKEFRGLRLGQTAGLDQPAQPNHQVRPDLEVCGFLG